MRKNVPYVLLSIFLINPVLAADKEKLTQESRSAIKTLATELKTTLQSSMKAKGPVASLSVCKIEAPKIANRISTENNMDVGRTSLKYRNSINKPDDWEKKVLTQFDVRKANGEKISSIDYSEIVEQDGKKNFRYMKAIPTGEVCLKCHGSSIAAPIASKLKDLYPDDRAIGYKKGDIRGAFTIVKDIN